MDGELNEWNKICAFLFKITPPHIGILVELVRVPNQENNKDLYLSYLSTTLSDANIVSNFKIGSTSLDSAMIYCFHMLSDKPLIFS